MKLFKRVNNFFSYASASIKNRYPCKIEEILYLYDLTQDTQIQYRVLTRFDVRIQTIQEILLDPLLIEKFHPSDGARFGFIAAADLLLKKRSPNATIQVNELLKEYKAVGDKMFCDYMEDNLKNETH
jgi:hypothetical protein